MLGGALLGNGNFLLMLDGQGQVLSLNWPDPDGPQHLGRLQINLFPSQGPLPKQEWQSQQEYLPGNNILKTSLTAPGQNLQLDLLDMVGEERDFWLRRATVSHALSQSTDLTLSLETALRPGGIAGGDSLSYDSQAQALVQYHRRYVFALGSSHPPAEVEVHRGRQRSPYPQPNALGGAGARCTWNWPGLAPGQVQAVNFYLAAGHNITEALSLLQQARAASWQELIQSNRRYWQGWLAQQQPPAGLRSGEQFVYQRSLLVLPLLQARRSGALLAGPEIDPYFRHSGGYAYSWPRDGVYIALALQKAGYPESARRYYRFLSRVQQHDGLFAQRYQADGSPGPSWGPQLDESAAVLWAVTREALAGRQPLPPAALFPLVEQTAAALVECLRDGLPQPCFDLWEERWGIHAYTCASTAAALNSAARWATTVNLPGQARLWYKKARQIARRTQEVFWDPRRQTLARTLLAGNRLETTADISLLGLVWPFQLLSPRDSRVLRTIRHMLPALSTGSGLLRYQEDTYRGGNPWPLATLWLALYYQAADRPQAARHLLARITGQASPLGLLPEQIHATDGTPAWVLPLAWSHAFYLLTCQRQAKLATANSRREEYLALE